MSSVVPDFLVHHVGDDVGVAISDLEPGPARGGYLTGDQAVDVQVRDSVPLGHKIALGDIPAGANVTEYGVTVAAALTDIAIGSHVHVHNVRSVRWHSSVAS